MIVLVKVTDGVWPLGYVSKLGKIMFRADKRRKRVERLLKGLCLGPVQKTSSSQTVAQFSPSHFDDLLLSSFPVKRH